MHLFNGRSPMAAVIAALVLTMFSCAKSGGRSSTSSEQVIDPDIAGYSRASCLYRYNEGPTAVSLGSENVVSGAFGKKYDLNLLRPVLGASESGLVHFAETTNVRFYHTDRYQRNGCDYLEVLPEAPSEITSLFTAASGQDVLGLYLPIHSSSIQATTSAAAITVRKNANKWILVHEYMHHLFQLQRSAAGEIDAKDPFIAEANAYDAAVTAISSATDRAAAIQAAAQKLANLNDLSQKFLKQYLLEEMSVEAVLASKLDSGDLKLVLSTQRLNGAAYTISSANRAKAFIRNLKDETQTFQLRYMPENLETSSDPVAASLSGYISMENEMAILERSARSYLRSQGYDYHGLVNTPLALQTNEQAEVHTHCSQEVIAEQVFAEMESILSQHQ